jgi:hypothetical protein
MSKETAINSVSPQPTSSNSQHILHQSHMKIDALTNLLTFDLTLMFISFIFNQIALVESQMRA